MLPRDDDRRTFVCCAIIAFVPVVLAAAQVTATAVVERWVAVPGVASALYPLWFACGVFSGAAAAWAAVLLPGGRTAFTIVAAVSAFIVGAAIYAVAIVPCAVLASFLV